MFGKFCANLINFLYFSIVYFDFIVKYSVRQSASSHLRVFLSLEIIFQYVQTRDTVRRPKHSPPRVTDRPLIY